MFNKPINKQQSRSNLSNQFKGAPKPATFAKKLGNITVTPITQ
jgi:hypothetical protein